MREFGGATEPYDARDVLRAGAALALVRTAVEERGELDAFADEERSRALGRVHLVAGDREEIDVFELAREVDGELGRGLDRVGVEEGAVRLGEAGEFAYGLDGAGFVVGQHDRDETRVGLQRGGEVVRGDDAAGVWLEVGDLDAAALEGFGGEEHRVMLDCGGDEVRGLAAVQVGLQDAGEREVVAFGAAGGEDDLAWRAVKQGGDLSAGALNRGAGALAAGVGGAWVAEAVGPEGLHRGEDLGQNGRGGVRVEVDPHGS